MNPENRGMNPPPFSFAGQSDSLADAECDNETLDLLIEGGDWQRFEAFLSREAPVRLAQGNHAAVLRVAE